MARTPSETQVTHYANFLISMLASLAFTFAVCAQSSGPSPSRKPWNWPKKLVDLKFGEKTRYRDSDFWVEPVLRKDGESELIIFRADKEFQRIGTGIGGQFSILDVDTPIPTVEGWGENIHNREVRWLLCAFYWREQEVSYGWAYMEIYTPNPNEARSDEIYRVARRTNVTPKEFRFYDWAEKYEPKNADSAIQTAKTIKG